jgi:hypothetical protein
MFLISQHDFTIEGMTAIILHRTYPAKNMRRFHRLDVQRDLFGQVCFIREWGRHEQKIIEIGILCSYRTNAVSLGLEGKLVGNFMDVIFTSDAAGKTGYQLTEDGCKPVTLTTEYSTEAAPVGMKVVSLRDIHLYDESSGVPVEAKMESDPEVALKECSTILAALARQGRQTVCGVHDKVLETQEAHGLHVMLQAKASSKAGV